MQFLEELQLLVVKNNLPMLFVGSMWLKCLVLHLCSRVSFPFKKQFSQDILPCLMEKTKQLKCSPT
jgi:hypothetical protein